MVNTVGVVLRSGTYFTDYRLAEYMGTLVNGTVYSLVFHIFTQ